MLLDSCKVPDLIVISAALDAFFDVFAEDFYNYALAEFNVVQQMEAGMPGLKQMVSAYK